MAEDQRFAAVRPDVLVYQTAGPGARTWPLPDRSRSTEVSTSGTDSDWVVKLIDVYPDDYPDPNPNPAECSMGGYQQLVRGEPFRGKFRNSFEKPEPFAPSQPTAVRFRCRTFATPSAPATGIMVQVQSSWFPLVDRNPQTFVDIYTAKPSDFRKCTPQRVLRRQPRFAMTVPVLP